VGYDDCTAIVGPSPKIFRQALRLCCAYAAPMVGAYPSPTGMGAGTRAPLRGSRKI
jgi:hypothetical protein